MAYLLDTCVVSDLAKGDPNTIFRLRSKSPIEIKISSVTVYELKYGIFKQKQIKKLIKDTVFGFRDDIEIVPFGANEAEFAAQIRADLESVGTPIGPYDILIGASALVKKFTLVTSNTSEFERIKGISLEDWRT